MQIIIDRFEGEIAVCEKSDRTMLDIPRSSLPAEAKQGDVLVVTGNTIRIDPAATAKRRKAAEEMMKENLRKPDL
jgi:hypothetical protein